MFGRLRTWILLLSLMALGILALPASPGPEPSGGVKRPLEVENARALLGEEPADARQNVEKTRETGTRREAGAIRLSVPRLGITNLPVPTGSTQAELDREGLIRLDGTGLPVTKGSNTFIVGHALGYPSTRVRFVFRYLDRMKPGDEIMLNSGGKRYTFRVYDRLTVRPQDYWVTYPVAGKTVVSLQSCTPYPTFENRIVVRGELVG